MAFVDGTMRTEARLTYTGPLGEVSTGLATSHILYNHVKPVASRQAIRNVAQ